MNDPLERERFERLLAGREHAPSEILGRTDRNGQTRLVVFNPAARAVAVVDGPALQPTQWPGVFACTGPAAAVPEPYRLQWRDASDRMHVEWDAYAFRTEISAHDRHLFNEGQLHRAYEVLGALPHAVNGVDGIRFAVWAPNAERVSVVGDFNAWDGRRHPMNAQGSSGIWCLFVPAIEPGARYKFEIRNRHTGAIELKADPYAREYELRPNTASVVCAPSSHRWTDDDWLTSRRSFRAAQRPISIYEVHLGSWQRDANGEFLDYRTLAARLAEYATQWGFSHVELLPVTEHPFDGSWGYQTVGYFAPTRRFGSPDDFRWFVDHLHHHGIGVLLDWAPAHFPRDPHGLARFDGTAFTSTRTRGIGEHRDWDTLIFNYGRNEVRNFLTSSALFWLLEFHIDGLRVDAVASMLYLDYSRAAGDWLPEPARRPRESRRDCVDQEAQRTDARRVARHDDRRGGVDRVAAGDAADRTRADSASR